MTTATADHTAIELSVSAHLAAVGWMNAFVATGDDPEHPILYKTLSVEFFNHGVQFIGCNGNALFRAWVPKFAGLAWPDTAREPNRRVVVMDPDGFAVAWMRALKKVTADESNKGEVIVLSLHPYDEEAGIALGEEFQKERLTLRSCGQRIDCRLLERDYPGWRHLKLGVDEAERVEGFTMATKQFALLGKLQEVGALDIDVAEKRVTFESVGDPDDSKVRGFLMPMMRPRPAKKKATTQATTEGDGE